MTGGAVLRRHGTTVAWIAAVAVAYYAAARLGLLAHLVREQVTPLWPPTGIALAALLLLGPRVWPGIALGALATNAPLGPSPWAVLAIVAGNTLGPVCSYLLLRRAGFRVRMDRLRDALALVFLGAPVGTLLSATVGSGALAASGVLDEGGFWPTWSVWWTGDAMGVLVVTPVILVLSAARPPRRVSARRWAEAAALLVGTFAVALPATTAPSLLFLVFPVLIWAAFRFQLAGAAPCALVVSTLAVLAASRGSGPFAGHGLLSNMITLQAFNGAAALTALLLAASVTERNAGHAEIQRACDQLSDIVHRLEASTSPFPLPPATERRERHDGLYRPRRCDALYRPRRCDGLYRPQGCERGNARGRHPFRGAALGLDSR